MKDREQGSFQVVRKHKEEEEAYFDDLQNLERFKNLEKKLEKGIRLKGLDLGCGRNPSYPQELVKDLDFTHFDLVDKEIISGDFDSKIFKKHQKDILDFLRNSKYSYDFVIVSNVFHLIPNNTDAEEIFRLLEAKMKRGATIFLRLQIRDKKQIRSPEYYAWLENFQVSLIKKHFKSGTLIYYRNPKEEVVSIKFINYELLVQN